MNRTTLHRVIWIGFLIEAGLFLGYILARQGAVRNATAHCTSYFGVLVEQPREIHAQLTTYDKAYDRLYPGAPAAADRNPDAVGPVVWAVDMKGDWILVGGPAPDPTKPPGPPPHIVQCRIIVDALSGRTNMEGRVE